MEDKTYRYCLIAFPILMLLALVYHLGIMVPTEVFPKCLFRYLTGFSCPGCGCTRAAQSLMGGHIVQSVRYNPVVLYGSALYAVFFLSHTAERLISFTEKKLPSLFHEGRPLHKLKHIHGMRKKPVYVYAIIYIMLIFGVARFFVELAERISTCTVAG